MILWRIDALVAELRTRAVTSGEVLGYLLAYLLPGMLLGLLPLDAASPSRIDVAIEIAQQLVILGGIAVAYVANGGAEGRDFAGRLVAVSWVVGLRTAVVGMFAIVLAIGGLMAVKGVGDDASSLLGPVLEVVLFGLSLGFFWRLSHHLKSLAR